MSETDWIVKTLSGVKLLCSETSENTCDVPRCYDKPEKIFIFDGDNRPEVWQFCAKHAQEITERLAKECVQ